MPWLERLQDWACRSGTTLVRYGNPDEIAWYCDNSVSETHPIRMKLPNAWGLYDMLGNVWEWCQDYFEHYSYEDVVNPTGNSWASRRIFRGACWNNVAGSLRAACRGYAPPAYRSNGLGFRLAKSVS